MKKKFNLACQTASLADLRKFLEEALSHTRLSESELHQVTLAVEEVCANLIIHSHQCNALDKIWIQVTEHPEGVTFEIKDRGEAFNLLTYEVPDLQKVITEKRKGGLGILLVKKIMDRIEFESTKGTNVCRLTKFFMR